MPMFRIVPNTAISELQSMTLIASRNAGQELETLMVNLFSEMGMAMILPEDKLEAATALTSCGIAYVLKYILEHNGFTSAIIKAMKASR